MNLTPEQVEQGRRNFLKVLAGTPALAALGVSAALKGPVPGGPVRVGFIGVGSQGRSLLGNVDPAFAEVRALCDINPNSLKAADEVMTRNSWPPARHYADWQEMLQKEDLEAVIMAPPLWAHADIAVGLSRRRQARAVREDDGVGRAELRAHARRGAQEQQGARDRLPAPVEPDVSGGLRRHPQDRRRSATSITSGWRGIATDRGGARAIRRLPTTIPRSGAIPTGITCSTGASTGSTRRG